ncbi:phytoene/squalene synthase family protein [Rhodovibrionaceae bacterium A322]
MSNSPKSGRSGSPLSLASQLKKVDPDRYLASLFVPRHRREALFALYAFNHEIAKTAEVVSDATLGEIRLQWWRDAIDELFKQQASGSSEALRHEVLGPLSRFLCDHRLSRAHFDSLIDARRRDLDLQPFATLSALESYLEQTSVPLLSLAVELQAGEAITRPTGEMSPDLSTAVHHVALAYGLSGTLRAVPFLAQRKRCHLPLDHLTAVGVSQNDVFAQKGSDQLDGLVMRLAQRAEEHLTEARTVLPQVPRSLRRVLLPSVLAERNLALLEQQHYDVFKLAALGALPSPIFALGWAAWRNRY